MYKFYHLIIIDIYFIYNYITLLIQKFQIHQPIIQVMLKIIFIFLDLFHNILLYHMIPIHQI